MADVVAEAPARTEKSLSGRGEGEGNREGHEGAGVAGRKVDVNGAGASASDRAGDPSSSNQEPSVSDRSAKGKAAEEGASPAPDGMHRGFLPMPNMENWPFNPAMMGAGFDALVPVLLPAPFPCYVGIPGHDQHPPPGGIFAVPVMPMFGSMGSMPQGGFIPLSFVMPPVPPPLAADVQTQAASPAARTVEAGRAAPPAEARDAAAPDGLRQRHVAAAARQPQGAPRPGEPQRQPQVVRRFQVGFQLDLLLILKLVVVVIVFNQDGTKDRLLLLVLLAGIVYLYQTGALAPILRWISQSAQRAMMPPQQPLPGADGAANLEAVRAAPPNVREAPMGPEVREDTPPGVPVPDGVVGRGEEATGTVGVNEQRADQQPQNPNWWGIIKELQMIVVGFLTSLLPGFQHVE